MRGSEQIRAARDRYGLSQAALAEHLGVHQSTVARWEAGVTSVRPIFLRALSDLGAPTSKLIPLKRPRRRGEGRTAAGIVPHRGGAGHEPPRPCPHPDGEPGEPA